MTRTFLTTLEISPDDDPSVIAQDILESLSQDQFFVISVTPWASPAEPTAPTEIL